MSGTPPALQRPRPRLGFFRALLLSLVSIGGGGLAACAVVAGVCGAWTWVQLGAAGVLLALAVGMVLVVRRRKAAIGAALVLVVIASLRIAIAVGPGRGVVRPEALVRCKFADGVDRRMWFAGIPERETVGLGARLGMTIGQRARHLAPIEAAYVALESEGLFERDSTPLLESWLVDRGQYWLAVPEGRGPFPLLVFLHGNGGSFLFYPQLLAKAAVARGFAIAFPAAGMGLYGGSTATEVVTRTIESARREAPIDETRVVLVGLSAGCSAAVIAAQEAQPGRYKALVSISGAFPRLDHSERLKGTPLLVLHGTEDINVTFDHARRATEYLRGAGVPVELVSEEGADHYALFTHRKTWVPKLLDFAHAACR